jgi:DNA methylase
VTTARFLVGDVFDRMAEIPDGSVDLVLTSPPFLALRSYLPPDHPDKGKEIGSESTPAAFLDTLLRLTAEWRRVLAPHGSLCVELGDTYSGSGGAGGDYLQGGLREGQPRFRQMGTREHRPPGTRPDGGGGTGGQRERAMSNIVPLNGGPGWPLPKSLCMIPELYATALAYGINPLTGEVSPAGRWRVRNVVAWVRANPPVGALGDKFRPATSYLTIACTSGSRYFDLDAVRTTPITDLPQAKGNNTKGSDDHSFRFAERVNSNPAGAPPLDWWLINPVGYPGAHYAVYPPELCIRPILAMAPQRVCVTCGEPSRRIVGDTDYLKPDGHPHDFRGDGFESNESLANRRKVTGHDNGNMTAVRPTVGWSDCGHGTWRPGHVLDPFAGSGTTLAVATGHGRTATGIDLDARNADLAQQRVGMFLTIDEPTTEPTV